MQYNAATLLRTLKGAPLSVLAALFLTPTAVSESWLAGMTGYHVQVVRQALTFLGPDGMGLAQRNGRYSGWHLTGEAYQLPLPLQPLPAETENLTASAIISLSRPTTTTTNIEERSDAYAAVAAESNGSAILSPSVIHSSAEPVGRVDNLLRTAGVGEPTRTQLKALAWATPEYIQAHIEHGRANGDKINLVIYRIRSGDPQPETPNSLTNQIPAHLAHIIRH